VGRIQEAKAVSEGKRAAALVGAVAPGKLLPIIPIEAMWAVYKIYLLKSPLAISQKEADALENAGWGPAEVHKLVGEGGLPFKLEDFKSLIKDTPSAGGISNIVQLKALLDGVGESLHNGSVKALCPTRLEKARGMLERLKSWFAVGIKKEEVDTKAKLFTHLLRGIVHLSNNDFGVHAYESMTGLRKVFEDSAEGEKWTALPERLRNNLTNAWHARAWENLMYKKHGGALVPPEDKEGEGEEEEEEE